MIMHVCTETYFSNWVKFYPPMLTLIDWIQCKIVVSEKNLIRIAIYNNNDNSVLLLIYNSQYLE